jgi:hypothetical protein
MTHLFRKKKKQILEKWNQNPNQHLLCVTMSKIFNIFIKSSTYKLSTYYLSVTVLRIWEAILCQFNLSILLMEPISKPLRSIFTLHLGCMGGYRRKDICRRKGRLRKVNLFSQSHIQNMGRAGLWLPALHPGTLPQPVLSHHGVWHWRTWGHSGWHLDKCIVSVSHSTGGSTSDFTSHTGIIY